MELFFFAVEVTKNTGKTTLEGGEGESGDDEEKGNTISCRTG